MKDPSVEPHLRWLLDDLGRAMNLALTDAENVHDTVRRIRSAGYQLLVQIDAERDGVVEEKLRLRAAHPNDDQFKLNTQDVAFLRSLGIDPTRRVGRRRVKKPRS